MEDSKELRQGAIITLNKLNEKLIEKEAICRRIERETGENRAAEMVAKPPLHKVVEDWIYLSWLIDVELMHRSIETVEKWIVDGNYPI